MLNLQESSFQQNSPLNKIIVFFLQLEVFLLPLFFLPFTFEIFDFSKQNLLWLCTFAATLTWLVKAVIVDKKIVYKKTPLDIPLVIFILVWGLSMLLSVDRFSSLFGFYGRFSDAYLGSLSFVLLYFLILNTLTPRQAVRFFKTFLLSAGIALGSTALSILGILARFLPAAGRLGAVASSSLNPLGGSSETAALFAAAILVLVCALYSYQARGAVRARRLSVTYGIIGALALLVLLAVNFILAWVAALVGMAFLFCCGLYVSYASRAAADTAVSVSIAPALSGFIFILLILFLFGGSGSIVGASLPREVVLPAQPAQEILWQSLKTRPLLGYGPGTFSYAFSAGRPASFNSNQFWQLRFDKAPAYLLELLATVGLLGLLSYLSVVGIFLFVSFIFVRNIFRNAAAESYLAFGFSFAALTLFAGQALYVNSTTLLFAFWLFIALAMLHWRLSFAKIFATKEIDLRAQREIMPVLGAFVAVAVLAFAGLLYTQTRYYIADVSYNNFRLSGNAADLTRAIALNPGRLNYRLALARSYLNSSRAAIAALSTPAGAGTLGSEEKNQLQANIQRAIQAGEAATAVAPNSVMAWELLASLYRDVRAIAVGSVVPAIRYFEKAASLEPTNPVLLTELGKMYLANNQTNDAVTVLAKAIALKSDYAPAIVGLAKTYDSLGQPDRALVTLEEAAQRAPDAELVYETGRLYYNQNDTAKAIERFTQAIAARPDYANALYSLGLAYQKQGDNVKSLEQFQKVLELSPNNETVQKLVEELKGKE